MSATDPFSPAPAPSSGITLRGWTWIVQALYIATYFTGITCIIGVVIAYAKRAEAAGTVYESHLTYAIRSFWIGLILTVIGTVLIFVGIGVIILILAGLWWLVRLVRPVIALVDDRPISNPEGFF